MSAAPNYSLQDAADALGYIDPGCERAEWVKVAMAAKAAGVEFVTFDAWSEAAPNYTQAGARDTWRSISGDGGIKAVTLFHMARAAGWPGSAGRASAPTSLRKPVTRPAEAPKPPRSGMSAAEVWARCKPAPASHAYIEAKQGRPDGLRVVPDGDPLRINGERVAGWLVVPVVPLAGGEPLSLQFIAPPHLKADLKAKGKNDKPNLPRHPMKAGTFILGELGQADTAYLCEGIGQAWACWKATGAAAVVCFGWGNVRKVAAELRQRDASARLVLMPDKGKEGDAEAIARDVGAKFVSMPSDAAPNFDANDYAAANGHDALEVLLAGASKPQVPVHPLAQFVELDAEPMAPRFVIPGFIGYGLVIFAGTHGVGKTTALLPLAMVAAGLHARFDPLAPKHWRHVVYITEDQEQARRILAGIVNFAGLGVHLDTVRARLHIVEARRLEPSYVAEVATTYREQFARTVDGVEVPPLVVMDTKSAVFSIEEENSNTEASAIVAMLKQSFQSLPVWLVGHVSKANMGRGDVAGLALRGASAFEADANQVLYLVKEGAARYLVRGKTRFEAQWTELQIKSKTAATMARDEFGDLRTVTLRWAIASPPEQSRKEAQEQAQEVARKADTADLRDEVRDAIETAWRAGFPLNREGVKAKVKRNRAEVADTIENLLTERWLHEVVIPPRERTNPKRAAFLVNLTTEEHEAGRHGEGMPAEKLQVPASWRKPAPPSVPAAVPKEGETATRASHESAASVRTAVPSVP